MQEASEMLTEKTKVDKRDILFGFSFQNGDYIVLKGSAEHEGRPEYMKVSWNFWNGLIHENDPISWSAFAAGEEILDRARNDPNMYPLKGEHYSVEGKASSLGENLEIKVCKNRYVTARKVLFPILLRVLISLIFSAVFSFAMAYTSIGWLSFLFPKSTRETLWITVIVLDMVNTVLVILASFARNNVLPWFLSVFFLNGCILILGLMKRWYWSAFIISFFVLAMFLLFHFVRGSLFESGRWSGVFRSLLGRVYESLLFTVILCFFVTAVLRVQPYTYISSFQADETVSLEAVEAGYSRACLEILDVSFQAQSEEVKLDILQRICDYECIVGYGCPTATVTAGITSGEHVLGEYSDSERKIIISLEYLREGETEAVLRTLLHEIRHHWQHRMVDLYSSLDEVLTEEQRKMSPFREAQAFIENFNDYQSGTDDYEAYYKQVVEEDSRAWALKRIDEYYYSYIYPNR